MDSRRAEAFSDGVFAVAITVLVFNLLPIADRTEGSRHLLHALAGNWPAYLAYVVSFLTIGIMWLNHHTMMAHVRRVNRPVLVLNLLLLMGVVALPFPTALVAGHLVGAHARNGQASVAAVLYGLVMIAISICFATLWLYVTSRRGALGAGPALQASRASTIRFTSGLVGYLAATAIALAEPVAALLIYGLLAGYYLIEHLPVPDVDDATERP
ncbi:MAG TPA: TMEM175 family protein [Streptosporangiaceae bacterium]